MDSRLTKALAVVAAPLLTLAGQVIVNKHVTGFDKAALDAAGTALGALAMFALTQGVGELPKRSHWWRRHFDRRATFEGWWLQTHDQEDRAAVLAFSYFASEDLYRVNGNAFNSQGKKLAHFESTQIFYADDKVSYLWEGKSLDKDEWKERQGMAKMSLQYAGGDRPPSDGDGEVLHLNQNRILDFGLLRITPQRMRSLLGSGEKPEELGDISLQRRLVQQYLSSRSIGDTLNAAK